MTEPLKIQEDNIEKSPENFVSAYDLGSTQGTEMSSRKSEESVSTEGSQSTSTEGSQSTSTEASQSTSTEGSQMSPTETSSTEGSQMSPTETTSTEGSQSSPTETSSTEGSQSSNMKSIIRERSPLIINLREKSKQVTQKKYNSDINSAKNIHKSFSKKCYTISKWKPSKKQQWRNKLVNVMSKIISHSRKKNTYDIHNVQLDNLRNKINADLNKMTTCSKKPKPQKNTRKSNKNKNKKEH